MNFSERYEKLNSSQRLAVDTLDGPVMVIAGPGTGKTELLSVRAANILQKTDTLPENILCLTFTESGASAMRERLVDIIGRDAYKIAVHTFHSFGREIIAHNREYFYRGAQFQPADDIASHEILQAIFNGLELNNPLATTMNGEYTYLRDAKSIISQLKNSGLTASELRDVLNTNDLAIEKAEQLLAPAFEGRVSKETALVLESKLGDLQTIDDRQNLIEIPQLSHLLSGSLAVAINSALESGKTTTITAWRNQWFKKDETGAFVLKARDQQVKLRAIANIYDDYLLRMEKAGLYDFDDMLLQLVHALETYPDLRFNLQEKYLYIMVDEFQDTNLAHLRVVRHLTDNPVNEGRPNILVVGDDDQAIYSFQGAQISNILDFQNEYPSLKRIVLTDNYRSVAGILQHARSVITQGGDRLETRIAELSKELTAHRRGSEAPVTIHQANTVLDERAWVASAIHDDIATGAKPADIAVLTRHHRDIAALLPHFVHQGVAVQYEKRDNALTLEPILQLESLSRLIIALQNNQLAIADSLLPNLLSHPAWGFSPQDIWKLSINAYDAHQRWLDTMATMPHFTELHEWLTEMTLRARITPLEPMLDLLIGRPSDSIVTLSFQSPLYSYFFSENSLTDNPEQYLLFLDGLRSIREKLLTYKVGDTVSLEDFVTFIDTHKQLGAAIPIISTTNELSENAVHIMTAHAAKGLEFDTVYVIGAVDSTWGEKARSGGYKMISYPENLKHLAPAGESLDERLRLFYVALTRAKNTLHISYSQRDEKNKALLRASFLAADSTNTPQSPIPSPESLQQAVALSDLAWHEPHLVPSPPLHTLLAPTLAKYKLSATHLNAFTDILNAGPHAFLRDYLLHFPQAPSAQLAYGSAIHTTLQQAHLHFTRTGSRKPIEDVLGDFQTNLKAQRLAAPDFDTYFQKGSEELQAYLTARYDSFTVDQKTELNFAGQNSMVEDAILTGSLDLALVDTKARQIDVVDYKTGKPSTSWKGTTDFEKVKLHKYRQQLLFYKLLVESSRDYHTYTVGSCSLEFIKPTKQGTIQSLSAEFSHDDIERLKQLIIAVWKHICSLTIPDVSQYPATYKGVLQFEQDLIDGVI